jgi:hypothetical protein
MMCKLMSDHDPEYKASEPSVLWLIQPIHDNVLRRMTGRDQKKIYPMCSKHMRVMTKLLEEYVSNNRSIPSPDTS